MSQNLSSAAVVIGALRANSAMNQFAMQRNILWREITKEDYTLLCLIKFFVVLMNKIYVWPFIELFQAKHAIDIIWAILLG